MIDIDSLPPTISTTDAALLIKCSSATVRGFVEDIPDVYRNGSGWQIPKDSLRCSPLIEYILKAGETVSPITQSVVKRG